MAFLKRYKRLLQINGYITLSLLLLTIPAAASSCFLVDVNRPNLSTANTGPYLTTEENLKRGLDRIESGDPVYLELLDTLLLSADAHLDEELYSVTFKEDRAFIEDPHDYVSLYTYAWPNPDTEDNMPYISRDGQISEEVDQYDRRSLGKMSTAVENLSLAWYYSGEEKYAEKTADFIRSWFLNDETRMNPHFQHAQFTPGESKGGPQGIIEAREFMQVIEAASLIYDSPFWSPEEHRELKYWFYDFLRWMMQIYPADAFIEGNIGTWIHTQKSLYALFTEQTHLLHSPNFILPLRQRLDKQITRTGEQPTELNRVTSQHYTWFNLKAYTYQAEMRTNSGRLPDLEGNESLYTFGGDGGLISAALDWLMPYAEGTDDWNAGNHPVNEFNTCRYIDIFLPAALTTGNHDYEELVQKLVEERGCRDIRTLLTHPIPEEG